MMRKALASLLVFVFLFAAFASGMDRLSLSLPSLERLVPAPFRANAARSAAMYALLRNNLDLAEQHAIQAVRNDPIDPHSVALLATIRLDKREYDAAYSAYRTAALFGWRDQSTQVYWYSQALAVGDLEAALDRADAILRAWPSLRGTDKLLDPFEMSDEGRKLLLRHMGERPEWIYRYLNITPELPEDALDRRVSLLAPPEGSDVHLGCANVSIFIDTLLKAGRRGDAELVWKQHCPDRPIKGVLADPNFTEVGSPSASPFGWIVHRSGDVAVAIQGNGPDAFLALSNSAPVTRQAVSQSLALAPGTYRLGATFASDVQPQDVLFSFACDAPLRLPDLVRGDLATGPKIFKVGKCKRQEVGIWVHSNTRNVKLRSLRLEAVGKSNGG